VKWHARLRSSNRVDLIVLGTCALLALVARGFREMRDPVATSMRRTFLAPLVMLQEASRGQPAIVLLDRAAHRSSRQRCPQGDDVTSLENENDRLRQLIGLGSRIKWGFIPPRRFTAAGSAMLPR
jgi:hypothetical protein